MCVYVHHMEASIATSQASESFYTPTKIMKMCVLGH